MICTSIFVIGNESESKRAREREKLLQETGVEPQRKRSSECWRNVKCNTLCAGFRSTEKKTTHNKIHIKKTIKNVSLELWPCHTFSARHTFEACTHTMVANIIRCVKLMHVQIPIRVFALPRWALAFGGWGTGHRMNMKTDNDRCTQSGHRVKKCVA